jgi:hypothetical protein
VLIKVVLFVMPVNKVVSHHVTTALELIYSNVWGLAPTSVSGHNYYVSFVDAYSRFTWLYLIKRKSDVFDIFLQFQSHVEHLLNHKILHVQSDWVVSTLNLMPSFRKLVFLTGSSVLIHINRTVVLSVNIVTLLKLVSHYFPMPLFLFNTGAMRSLLHAFFLIACPLESSTCRLLLNVYLVKLLTTLFLRCLVVSVGLIFVPTIIINLNIIPRSVSS